MRGKFVLYPSSGILLNKLYLKGNQFVNKLKCMLNKNKDNQAFCYEMDKTSISMFEILEPGGSALGKYSI